MHLRNCNKIIVNSIENVACWSTVSVYAQLSILSHKIIYDPRLISPQEMLKYYANSQHGSDNLMKLRMI